MTYEKTLEGNHQFRVPTAGGVLAMRVTHEGIILDVENAEGEVIQSAYQLWCDLEDMTHGGE